MNTNNNNATRTRPRWFGPAMIALVLLLVAVAGWIIRDLTAPNEAQAPPRRLPLLPRQPPTRRRPKPPFPNRRRTSPGTAKPS